MVIWRVAGSGIRWGSMKAERFEMLYQSAAYAVLDGYYKEAVALAGKVDSVVFSPDGTLLISGGSDERVRIWDAATGTEI